jgi:uncharacterized protein YutE (UPF0331/DUF86 family)
MDVDRRNRYDEKMGYLLDRIVDLPVENLSPLEQDGVYYRLVTAIDAAMDLVAMMLKDIGQEVGDDYQNIEKLMDLNKIMSSTGSNLKKCNGMRNALVHKYNGVDSVKIMTSVDEIQSILEAFIKEIEEYLNGFGENTD